MRAIFGILILSFCIGNLKAQISLKTDKTQICYGELIRFYIELDAPVSDFDSLFLLPGDGNKIDLLKLPEPTKFSHFFNPGEYHTALFAYNNQVNTSVLGSVVVVSEPPLVDFDYWGWKPACNNGGKVPIHIPDRSSQGQEIVASKWFIDGLYQTKTGYFKLPVKDTVLVEVKIVDENGCKNTIAETLVLPHGPLAKFKTFELNEECFPKTIVFNNTSKVDKDLIDYWVWNWGVGKRFIDTSRATEENFDFHWDGFVKEFLKDGWISPMLVIKYKNGCVDSFVKKNAFLVTDYDVEFSFSPVLVLHDSILATTREVSFRMKPRPNAQSFKWSFGDPTSGYLNSNDASWSPSHKYTNIGQHHVSIKVYERPCPRRDTTWCNIPILGPHTKIQGNDRPNNYLPIRPIPYSAFEHLAMDTLFRQKTGIDSIEYLSIDSVPTYVYDSIPLYGNANYTLVHDKIVKGLKINKINAK